MDRRNLIALLGAPTLDPRVDRPVGGTPWRSAASALG